MKPTIFILALLLTAGLYACSYGDKDSADADYCFYFESDDVKDKNEYEYVKFLLLKQNNILEPTVLDAAREYLKCYGESWGTFFDIDFANELDTALFSFAGLGNYSGHSGFGFCNDCPDSKVASRIKSVRQVELPAVIKKPMKENLKRTSLLRLQNGIFNAHKSDRFTCYSHDGFSNPPLLDTSYRTNFRVRITGKCGYLATKILPPAPAR
jgi:hypothetical protein